jgi:hypothetical protein
VGFYLFAMMWFDFEEEIVVGGRPSASLWFFVVPALQPSFYSMMVVLPTSDSSRSFFAFYTALCGLGIGPAYL